MENTQYNLNKGLAQMIKGIQEAVSIPVMAKCRIGHFVEAQILEAIEIDYNECGNCENLFLELDNETRIHEYFLNSI